MPVDFLDILLSLVHEQKLWWDLSFGRSVVGGAHFVVVALDRKVPQRDLVVGTRSRKDGVFCRMPFNGGNGSLVP